MWNVELKTLDYFSCVSVHDLGYSDPVSPNCPNTQVPVKQLQLDPQRPWHKRKISFDVKQGAEDFGLLFMCPYTWFCVFRPSFPKLPQYPSTSETGIAQPTEGPDTSVRFHFIWKKKLKTLDYFSCIPAHDLVYSSPVSPNCPNTLVLGIARARAHLMWNKELKTLEYFSRAPAHNLGYSGPVSQNCPNTWVPVKQV